MPRTTIDKTEPAETPELREQTWRVLRLVDEPLDAGKSWSELAPTTDSGEYGYRPRAEELGKLYGSGSFLLVELDESATYLSSYMVEVGEEPLYFDVRQRAEYERIRAERDAAEAEAEVAGDA
jgi:hypothetical protein